MTLLLHSLLKFFRNHRSTIVKLLVIHQNMATIGEVAECLQSEPKSLIVDCLPQIFIFALPLNAASRDAMAAKTVSRQIKTAAACYDLLVSELGKDVSVVLSVFAYELNVVTIMLSSVMQLECV